MGITANQPKSLQLQIGRRVGNRLALYWRKIDARLCVDALTDKRNTISIASAIAQYCASRGNVALRNKSIFTKCSYERPQIVGQKVGLE